MPEGIQYGEKGEAAQEAINNLEYADNELYELSSFLERLDEAISYLEEPKHEPHCRGDRLYALPLG